MNCWTVYRHISPSGKVYIGITSRDPKRRWNCGKSFVMIGDQKLICFESIYNGNKLYIPVVQNIGDTSMGQVECCFWVSWINQQNQAFCLVYSFYEGEPTSSQSNYDVARSNGLPLRPVKK